MLKYSTCPSCSRQPTHPPSSQKTPREVPYAYSKRGSIPAAPRTASPAAGRRLAASCPRQGAPSGTDRSHGAAGVTSGSAKPGFNWTGGFVPLLTPGSVPLVTSFHAPVTIPPASFSQKMSQASPSHCLILPRGHFRQTSSLLPPSQRQQFWDNCPLKTDSVGCCIPMHSLYARCFPTTPGYPRHLTAKGCARFPAEDRFDGMDIQHSTGKSMTVGKLI